MKLKLPGFLTGIVVSILLFVGFLITFLFYSFRQDVGLVREDYYTADLKYQEQIDRLSRTSMLDESPEISFTPGLGIVIALNNPDATGQILLFRPSDSSLDKTIPLQITDGFQVVPLKSLKDGLWIVKLSWVHEENEYYAEEKVVVRSS